MITALPYDRANTTMREFVMCVRPNITTASTAVSRAAECLPACGPQLEWTAPDGRPLAQRDAALLAAVEALRAGKIVAVKGIGGFHLMVPAHDNAAVQRLRQRKRREEKPFAVMFPSLDAIRAVCNVTAEEQAWLESPAAPIVLLKKRANAEELAKDIAPGLPWMGAMLPYTPLHHLLMRELMFPVVATSGTDG